MSREGWDQKQLGDLVTFQRGHDLSKSEFVHGKYPIAGSNGIIGYHHALTTKGPSITIGRSGNLGTPYFYKDDFWAHNTTLYVKEFHNTDPKFIYYLLKTLDFTQFNSGSAVPSLNRNYIHPLEVYVPETIETQRRIASILSALDERIELNRQTNATLEALARALFKSWFVDFDPVRAKADGYTPVGMDADAAELFPNKFIKTELGEIPVSWEIKSIGEIAERVAMGPFGSSIKVETFADEGIPIISGQHLRGFMLEDSTYNFITLEHAEKLNKANVYPGDVIFTHAGNIGNLAFIPEDSTYPRYVVSQRQFFMRCNPAKITPSFITYYFQSPEGLYKLLANTSSVGVPSIAQPVTYLKSIKLPIPPRAILEAFEQIIIPLHRKYRENNRESSTLAEMRDALLPKLMRGEIEV
ncbi:MAG: restriction endonuclease subunit S [Deltaproteobacteria bacterium]|nr:restriction endonuclease subunit S [Deltaproteobacteria bacterium]